MNGIALNRTATDVQVNNGGRDDERVPMLRPTFSVAPAKPQPELLQKSLILPDSVERHDLYLL
ncbi:hypothetical protein CCP4SC76_7090001 [Gammaproteobacteria bacterium]